MQSWKCHLKQVLVYFSSNLGTIPIIPTWADRRSDECNHDGRHLHNHNGNGATGHNLYPAGVKGGATRQGDDDD